MQLLSFSPRWALSPTGGITCLSPGLSLCVVAVRLSPCKSSCCLKVLFVLALREAPGFLDRFFIFFYYEKKQRIKRSLLSLYSTDWDKTSTAPSASSNLIHCDLIGKADPKSALLFWDAPYTLPLFIGCLVDEDRINTIQLISFSVISCTVCSCLFRTSALGQSHDQSGARQKTGLHTLTETFKHKVSRAKTITRSRAKTVERARGNA
jgi:hypothetical protein